MPRTRFLFAVTSAAAATVLHVAVLSPAGAVTVRSDVVVHCYEVNSRGQLAGGPKGTVFDVVGERLAVVLAPDIVTAQCTDFAFNADPVDVTAVFADNTSQPVRIGTGETHSFFRQTTGSDLQAIKTLVFVRR